jgi:hypothetical protein
MTVIVNSGSTLTIAPADGLTLTADSTIAPLGVLTGVGTISGPFELLNVGSIIASSGLLDIDTGAFANLGTVLLNGGSLTIENSVTDKDLSGGTLTGGTWLLEGGDLRVLAGSITTLDTGLTVSGTATIEDLMGGTAQPIENTLSVVGTAGLLDLNGTNWSTPGSFEIDGSAILSNATLSAAGGITVDGSIILNSASLSAPGGLTIAPSGQVSIVSGGLPTQVLNDGTIFASGLGQVGSLTGTGTVQFGGQPTVDLSSGTYTQTFATSGTGTVFANSPGGTVALDGQLLGAWNVQIVGGPSAAAATAVELAPSISRDVYFDSNADVLVLDALADYHNTLWAMVNTSTIVLNGIIANAASLTGALFGGGLIGGALSISENGSVVGALELFGGQIQNFPSHLTPYSAYSGPGYDHAVFTATPNIGLNNTTITLSGESFDFLTTCFRAGTRIATERGEIPVERLKIGDQVLTHFEASRPVVWLGHRTIDCRRHPDPVKILPVRVVRDAFGPGCPRRDLFLSPGHAVFVDGDLIPVKCLINDTTVRQVPARRVTYFHVELNDHDVLFAEGLRAESYLDTGNRPAFENGGASLALFPDFSEVTWETMGCAPLVLTGAKLTRVRDTLAQRAVALEERPPASLTPAA